MRTTNPPSRLRQLVSLLSWTRHSYYLMSAFLLTIGLIIYIWRPLAEEYLSYIDWRGPWWRYFDWLLLGIFLFMSLLIIARANLRVDWLIIFIGTFGGLVIESWGTQTNLWFYYTQERPPLWIIPAWPIASLSIDRLARILSTLVGKARQTRAGIKLLYWITFISFYLLMLVFVTPTLEKSFTWIALLLCTILILTPTDHFWALLHFLAGSGLGYFLELWGTTRQCWTYYTFQTPPLFAVLAHGMAAVAFWRSGLVFQQLLLRIRQNACGSVPETSN
ncbi:MAG: hypothetical protein JXA13_08765 [Anaerolineales bacterium]|nr:hypothetical protein [Anaerolineales bacterium]